MKKLTFCPFINSSCKSDCVFHSPFDISLNNGQICQCKLASFVSCSDQETIDAVRNSINNLLSQKE